MGSEPFVPGDANAGFEKLASNKYLAPVTAIQSTPYEGPDTLGTVGIPEKVFQMLEGEGYLMDRVSIAKLEDETLGQYSGSPAHVESVEGLYGAIVPDYAATPTERFRIRGGNGVYQIQEWDDEPKTVCITFPDDDTPMSIHAQGYEKLGEDDWGAIYHDTSTDTDVLRIK